jgi:hypothetical protein
MAAWRQARKHSGPEPAVLPACPAPVSSASPPWGGARHYGTVAFSDTPEYAV